ncbi:MAG: glycosyltransferase family 2 protein [Ignavibacteriae bacterium]|nr:glycosyltransferase family 2 protein [Ignavibacteria bacterium]MBI3364386.1 glycosyltransferase family 2 protein [Ignavibacteriota bacterium]
MALQQVTTTIINFQTPDLTERAVGSFRQHYPRVPLLLIDNGSRDRSAVVLQRLQAESPGLTELLLNEHNLHHGPAMDQALRHLQSPFILFLDSDCEVKKKGFIESMLVRLTETPGHYIIGKRIFMNKRGFDIPESPLAIPYIRPVCMLVRRELYLTLPPFQRHGTPCLLNMREATGRGLTLLPFPVDEYIYHEGRGTAGRHGYKLGWRGKLNHVLNRLGL